MTLTDCAESSRGSVILRGASPGVVIAVVDEAMLVCFVVVVKRD